MDLSHRCLKIAIHTSGTRWGIGCFLLQFFGWIIYQQTFLPHLTPNITWMDFCHLYETFHSFSNLMWTFVDKVIGFCVDNYFFMILTIIWPMFFDLFFKMLYCCSTIRVTLGRFSFGHPGYFKIVNILGHGVTNDEFFFLFCWWLFTCGTFTMLINTWCILFCFFNFWKNCDDCELRYSLVCPWTPLQQSMHQND